MNQPYPTLYEYFTSPEFQSSVSKINCINTSILRFYLAGVKEKKIQGKRLNKKQIENQLVKLKDISVDQSFDIEYHLSLVEKGCNMYGKNTKTQMKADISYARVFFEFVKNSMSVSSQKEEDETESILPYRQAIMDKSMYKQKSCSVNRQIILQNEPLKFIDELKNKYPHLSQQQLVEKSTESLTQIFDTFNNFAEFRKNEEKLRDRTINTNVDVLRRFFGWCKEELELTIDELSITKIIPVIDPYINNYQDEDEFDDNFMTELAKKEWLLKSKINRNTKSFIKLLNRYFNTYMAETSTGAKVIVCNSLIALTKYLYYDITDEDEGDDYQDIKLINRLKAYRRNLEKDNCDEDDGIVPPFNREETIQVAMRLKKLADQNYEYNSGYKYNRGNKLSKFAKALHLQSFLVIGLMVFMPTDRSRTYRELTFGETLVYGIYDPETGNFTSYDQLAKEEVTKSKYYIHLLPHQYKTGKTYGEFWYQIENIDFGDGTFFYDYLNKWLFEGYRDELATAGKTNAVFIRARSGISFRDSNRSKFGGYVRSIFLRLTKYNLSPHKLRTIFVTYINNLGLSDKERESIAYIMHHSKEMADKVYNKQTSREKMAIGIAFMKQENSLFQAQ